MTQGIIEDRRSELGLAEKDTLSRQVPHLPLHGRVYRYLSNYGRDAHQRFVPSPDDKFFVKYAQISILLQLFG